MKFEATREWAQAQDDNDSLARLRARFALPASADGTPLAYLCGHSLGLAPLAARQALESEFEDWSTLGVLGHEQGRRRWIGYAEQFQRALAPLVGAREQEVVAMNSLTINLHLMLASFYRPSAARHAILIEAGAFSSDRHAVASQIAWHGLDPRISLIELAPRAGEDLIRVADVEATIATQGARLALVLWPGVQYRTGQAFDLKRIATAAHAVGAVAGFDLGHSIGNTPCAMHEDQADFAVWCGYKYLNGGPGALAGAFVHERHLTRSDLPRLAGWWGHSAASRFEMGAHFEPASGAGAWAVSNPPIFSAAPLLASLELFEEVGMAPLRRKSLQLTGYLEFLVNGLCRPDLSVLTPAGAERGCQLSLRIRGGAARSRRMIAALQSRGVLCDWRPPDIIRAAPVPLYNSFGDVLRAVRELAAALHAHV